MLRLTDDLAQLARLGARLDPRVASFQARYELARRWRPADGALVAPTALYVETSSACRGRCAGCYVPLADRARPLRLDEASLATVLAAARQARPDYVCIVGGEPLDESIFEVNLAWVRSAPDVRFLLCTGAQGRCDTEALDALGELPNLSVIFSVDGLEKTHDRLRGEGSHQRTLGTLKTYAQGGRRVCGASVTLRRENWKEATSPRFLSELERAGCNFLVFDSAFGREELPSEQTAGGRTYPLGLPSALGREELTAVQTAGGRTYPLGLPSALGREELTAVQTAGGRTDPLELPSGREEFAPIHLAQAIERLRSRAADSRAVTFVNPYGRLLGSGFAARSAMAAAVIDYRGLVYASRRGAPLGDVKTEALSSILEGPAFQLACRRLPFGGSAADDPRTPLFEAARRLVSARQRPTRT